MTPERLFLIAYLFANSVAIAIATRIGGASLVMASATGAFVDVSVLGICLSLHGRGGRP